MGWGFSFVAKANFHFRSNQIRLHHWGETWVVAPDMCRSEGIRSRDPRLQPSYQQDFLPQKCEPVLTGAGSRVPPVPGNPRDDFYPTGGAGAEL
jgi:hypothetical protein